MNCVIGWDLGGANLKLARIEDGRVAQAAQIPCPIRQEASKFDAALAEALRLCPADALHAVTMTGELSDVFADRAEGVAYLVAHDARRNRRRSAVLRRPIGLSRLHPRGRALFRGGLGQLACERRAGRPVNPDALFIDVGTTTTDLVPLKDGAVAARGYSDGERLTEGELIYTGAVRTPVMAVARTAPFKGRMQGIAAERFATMADVWRLLGDVASGSRPLPHARSQGKEHARERRAACAHDRPRSGRRRPACRRRSCPPFRRMPACRDRGGSGDVDRCAKRLPRTRR